ncbi:MAG: hypothetical protein JXA20_18810 [Spirochaetes bacterium]|nr:hypothetical protein [Spirochaetota bacterium]
MRLFHRLSFRISIAMLLVFLAGTGSLLALLQRTQVRSLHEIKGVELKIDAALAARLVQNSMMAENPGFAAQWFSDAADDPLLSRVALHRIDGSYAFSDGSTVREVNGILGTQRFSPVEMPGNSSDLSDPAFRYAVNRVNEITTRIEGAKGSVLVYHLPLINQPRCTRCHGTDHVVRGVVRVTAPLEGEYRSMGRRMIAAMILCVIMASVLVLVVTIVVRREILGPLRSIGNAVSRAASGEAPAEMRVPAADEISLLARQSGRLIRRLAERRDTSPMDRMQSAPNGSVGSGPDEEWLTIEATILAVSLRGIAAEGRDGISEETLASIGESLALQGDIIRNQEGVIAAVAGYGLTAYFTGDGGALRALRAAEAIRGAFAGRGEGAPYVGMGVHAGTVTVGPIAGGTGPGAVIGEAADLCARLCASAGRNTIILSERCNEMAQGKAVTSPQAPLSLRGGRVQMNIYTLRRVL